MQARFGRADVVAPSHTMRSEECQQLLVADVAHITIDVQLAADLLRRPPSCAIEQSLGCVHPCH
jgi:hypothetical protein